MMQPDQCFHPVILLLFAIFGPVFCEDICNVTCFNGGRCQPSNTITACQCHPYFSGQDCSVVNLRIAEHEVDVDSISFTWPDASPILLANYSLVSHRLGASDDELRVESLPANATDEIEVENLQSERTRYVLCVLSTEEVESLSAAKLVTKLLALKAAKADNCGYVLTAYDGYGPYSTAALGVVICLAVTLFLLIVFSGMGFMHYTLLNP